MLDDRERQTLRAVERQLAEEDPQLAHALNTHAAPGRRPAGPGGPVRTVVALACLVAVLLLATGLVQEAMGYLTLVLALWALWHFSGPWQAGPCSPRRERGERA